MEAALHHSAAQIEDLDLPVYRLNLLKGADKGRQVTERLGVSAYTFQRLAAGRSSVTPDIAMRMSRVLGRSAESWLAMQDSHDLWQENR